MISENTDATPTRAVTQFKSLTARQDWIEREKRAIKIALRHAEIWHSPTEEGNTFWDLFWDRMESNYPDWKWDDNPQTNLNQFARVEEAEYNV